MNFKKLSIAMALASSLSAMADSKLAVSQIKSRHVSDAAAPLGQISYTVYQKDVRGNWVAEGSPETIQVGDCLDCFRALALMYSQLNGDASDLKQLGSGTLNIAFIGTRAAGLEYEVSSSGDLLRNDAAANVGMSLNSLKFIPTASQVQEIVFTTEDTNPFGTEHVAAGISTAPVTYKVVIEPIK